MSFDDQSRDSVSTTSRRNVLAAVGGGALAATGVVSGDTSPSRAPPDRHLVGLDADAAFGVASDRADSVYREIDFAEVGKVVAGRFPDAALDALRANPRVRYVEPESLNRRHGHPVSSPDDVTTQAGQSMPYGIDDVNADITMNNCKNAYGVDVAILD